MDKYLIWSEEHRAWWREDHRGYTQFIAEAGIYTAAIAASVCHHANAHGRFCEIMIPYPPELDKLKLMPSGGR